MPEIRLYLYFLVVAEIFDGSITITPEKNQSEKIILSVFVILAAAISNFAQSDQPTLFRQPAMSRTDIVFSYGGDLWTVAKAGGDAKRLTTGIGIEGNPYFSPDGSAIAFSGDYDGNTDAYIVPASGGVPRRITYHPSVDTVSGWTPDGKNILFASGRNSSSNFTRLFTFPVNGGGLPVEIPLPMANRGSLSPDGAAKEISFTTRICTDSTSKRRNDCMNRICKPSFTATI